MSNNNLVVSVCVLVYNHEKFIQECIDSILVQKCDFKYEIIIGEDCSKDNSRKIIQNYADRYPSIVKPLLHTVNVGAQANFISIIGQCKGKYIAVCEGDDYWIDPLKLQKQVDFMDVNPNFSMCFTNAEIKYEGTPEELYPDVKLTKTEFTFEDFIYRDAVFVHTATLFFRNILPNPMPEFLRKAVTGDIALHLLLLDKGKAKYIDYKTAVYRKHAGGLSQSPNFMNELQMKIFHLYDDANAYFNFKYYNILQKKMLDMSKTLLMYGSKEKKGIEKLKHVFKISKKYIYYSQKLNIKELSYYYLALFFPKLLSSSTKLKRLLLNNAN